MLKYTLYFCFIFIISSTSYASQDSQDIMNLNVRINNLERRVEMLDGRINSLQDQIARQPRDVQIITPPSPPPPVYYNAPCPPYERVALFVNRHRHPTFVNICPSECARILMRERAVNPRNFFECRR